MKDLIKQALDEAIIKLENSVPQTKSELVYVGIEDVQPLGIAKFMADNNIPDDAWFGGRENGYDAFSEVCLIHYIYIPTTDKDKDKYRKERFTSYAWKQVYDLLIKNGYKRIGCSSALYKEFDKTTVYEMYIANEFDKLVQYYSLSFAPIS